MKKLIENWNRFVNEGDKEEIEEQRPPLPPAPSKRPPVPPAPSKRPPVPKKSGAASAETHKAYSRFSNMLMKVIKNGLGSENTNQSHERAALYFLKQAGANVPAGGRNADKDLSNYLDSLDQAEAVKIMRAAYVAAAKGIRAYKQQQDKTRERVAAARATRDSK